MHVSEIIFFATGTVAFILHVKNISPTLRLTRRLESAVQANGGRLSAAEIGLRLQFSRNTIINESDTDEIRAIKLALVEQYNASMRFHRVVIWVTLSGFALSVVAGIVFG